MSAPTFTSEPFINVTDHTPNSTAAFNLAYWEPIFVAIIAALIAVMGIVGNSMIIVAVAFSRKLQTSTNAFVTSLSVADLLTSLFLIWYTVGLLGKNRWPLQRAEGLCAVAGFVIYNCTAASLYHLAAIGINRLILITKPYAYRRIFTSWKLGLLVALTWLIPCSMITLLVLTGISVFGYDKLDLSCSDLDSHKHGELFNYAQTMIGLPLPLVGIVVSYLWIYVYLKKHFRKQKANLAVSVSKSSEAIQKSDEITPKSTEQTMTSEDSIMNKSYHNTDEPCSVSETPFKATTEGVTKPGSNIMDEKPVVPSTVRRESISCQQIEITKNLFIVVCAFFACFVPYFIVNPVLGPSHAQYYVRMLPIANSAINFLIYARKHPDFKVVLGCMMRCSYADIPQPSRLLKFLLSKKT